jgi:hypothetical protein
LGRGFLRARDHRSQGEKGDVDRQQPLTLLLPLPLLLPLLPPPPPPPPPLPPLPPPPPLLLLLLLLLLLPPPPLLLLPPPLVMRAPCRLSSTLVFSYHRRRLSCVLTRRCRHVLHRADQRAKVEAEVARRRALLDPASRDLAANAAFALLAIDALFEVLKPAALSVMGGDAGREGGAMARAIADSATYAMYKDARDRMTAGGGGGGGGGSAASGGETKKKRGGGGGNGRPNPYTKLDDHDDLDDDDDDNDDAPLPPLIVSRAQYLEVIERLGVGRTPASLKLLNRVFSAFDPEVSLVGGERASERASERERERERERGREREREREFCLRACLAGCCLGAARFFYGSRPHPLLAPCPLPPPPSR